MRYIVLLLLLCNLASAGDAVPLHKGDTAPFDGVLLDVPTATEWRLKDIDLKITTKKLEQEQIDKEYYVKRLDLAHKEVDRLSDEVVKARSTTWMGKVGYFTVGVGFTVGVLWLTSKVIK